MVLSFKVRDVEFREEAEIKKARKFYQRLDNFTTKRVELGLQVCMRQRNFRNNL